MRLWHKDLIHVLPRKQLVSQWRECCAIAANLAKNDTPNHILVNKILDYPITDFISYTKLVTDEMKNRNYKVSTLSSQNFISNILIYNKRHKMDIKLFTVPQKTKVIFYKWHTPRYLIQCLYNLQEKHDCGGITEEEWRLLKKLSQTKIDD